MIEGHIAPQVEAESRYGPAALTGGFCAAGLLQQDFSARAFVELVLVGPERVVDLLEVNAGYGVS